MEGKLSKDRFKYETFISERNKGVPKIRYENGDIPITVMKDLYHLIQ